MNKYHVYDGGKSGVAVFDENNKPMCFMSKNMGHYEALMLALLIARLLEKEIECTASTQ